MTKPDKPDPNWAWGQLGGLLKTEGSPQAVRAMAVFLKEWVTQGGPLPDAWDDTREHFLECVDETIDTANQRIN